MTILYAVSCCICKSDGPYERYDSGDLVVCKICRDILVKRGFEGLPFDKKDILKEVRKIKAAKKAAAKEELRQLNICCECNRQLPTANLSDISLSRDVRNRLLKILKD